MNNQILDIVDFALQNDLNVQITQQTIKVYINDEWEPISVEAFLRGEASTMRFMVFVPLSEMKEEIIKKFELKCQS